MNQQFSTWKEVFFSSFASFLNAIVQMLPALIGALILLLLGWIVAKSISFVVLKLLRKVKFDQLAEKPPLAEYFEQAKLQTEPSKIIQKVIYWSIYLLFIITAAETLGLKMVSAEISKLVAYLPRLFSALLIFGIGVYLITFVRDFIRAATASLGMSTGKFISGSVFSLLLMLLMLTTLKQAGIDTDILTTNLTLILGALFFSFAISYGFASRDILSNILAGFFNKQSFHLGQFIEVDGVKGKITEMNSIAIKLETEEGIVVIPSHILVSQKVKIMKEIE